MTILEAFQTLRFLGFGGAFGAAVKLADSARDVQQALQVGDFEVPPELRDHFKRFQADLAEFQRLAFRRGSR